MRKTKEELEGEIFWLKLKGKSLFAWLIGISFFLIFFMMMFWVAVNQINYASEQLDECRASVPVWTFKVSCQDEVSGVRFTFEQDFDDQDVMNTFRDEIFPALNKQEEWDCVYG